MPNPAIEQAARLSVAANTVKGYYNAVAAEQQRRMDNLAVAYGRLRQDLDLALPGSDYLHALYTRLRGL